MTSSTQAHLHSPRQTALARTIKPKVVRRAAGRSRSLCPACARAVHDRLLLDSAGRLSAIADPRLLLSATEQTRSAALAALVADRTLWPALLDQFFAQPALRSLALERLRRELLKVSSKAPALSVEPITFGY